MKEIASLFRTDGKPDRITPIGNGLINETFLVNTDREESPDYVLQRINHKIFANVDLLQNNIASVTAHIRKALAKKGVDDLSRRTLTIIEAFDGRLFAEADGGFWRMTLYIPDSKTFESITPRMAELTGKAFGEFHTLLSLPDAPRLKESIPDFHNTPFRIRQLKQAIGSDPAGRAAAVSDLSSSLLAREEEMTLPFRLHAEGKLPKRITHCDTKVNNILFDIDNSPLCVIDLDTTMPGFVLSDFGDFMRTAGNTGAEDDPDLAKVGVNMDIFRSFAKGYLSSAKFLTPLERSLLPFGAKMLTYMQAVRFLTDYINGDTYYRISYPGHNLQRTKAQMKLLEDIDLHFSEMENFINNCYNNIDL
ncbi:MAG: aminoglycoside phosphotransferase family protein [Muribaculaceae bacterium]|nr:aminoglycoside phosphotransferase family protein [Muribaculaceae bacterium]